MRAVSHCANHPSREARVRCGSCATWICDLCAIEHGGRVFCSRRCTWRHHLRSALTWLRGIFAVEIPAAWAIGLTTAACLMAAAGIALLIGELLELSVPSGGPAVRVAVPVAPPPPSASVVAGDGAWRLVVDGAPGAWVVVSVAGEPATIHGLDENGHAELEFADYPSVDADVRIGALAAPMTLVSALPTATPTPTATAAPTSTATPTVPPPATAAATSPAAATPRPTSTAAGRPPDQPGATLTPTAATERADSTPAAPPPAAAGESLRSPPVLHLVPDAGPLLALTFDGAGSTRGTTDLLDLLRSLGLTVTIFVTGEFIDDHPGIVRRAALAGHEFGNHTYSHPHLTTYAANRQHDLLPNVDREFLHTELRRTEEAFRRATGRPMAPLWRAPFGEENRQLRTWAMEMGYLHVRWSSLEGKSLDSLDWVEDEHSRLYVDPHRLVERLLAFPHLEGGIVLMHLSTNRPVAPWADLPRFAEEVRARRLKISSVTELLEASRTWRPWYQRALARHREVFELDR